MLITNSEYLRPEIMDVLRMFGCEEENFTHYFSFLDGKFFNSIEYLDNFYDFENKFKVEDDITYRRYAKRFAKLAFYKVLSNVKGVHFSWGALTGIRPTKLAYSEINEGRDFKNLFGEMCVSEENGELVGKILEVQKDIYLKKGGQDLFISIPFCPTKCEYCSFITAPIAATEKYVDGYLNCLVKEIESVKQIVKRLNSIYIGGGTPFVLTAPQLEKVLIAVRQNFSQSVEFTVEAGRPDVFSEEKLSLCKEYGVTRICVNPQTFNDETLIKIGRKHTCKQTLEAFEMTKNFPFDINLDLIAGLADETVGDFCNSLNNAVKLNPENITVHTLSLKSGAKLKENTKRLDVCGIGDMIKKSRETLTGSGYKPYYLYRQKYQAGGLENTGWCKSKPCVYNVNVMEEISDNVAVGANAISKKLFDGGERIERLASPKDIPTYINKADSIIADRIKLFSNGENL